MTRERFALVFAAALLAVACTTSPPPDVDAGADGGEADAGVDAAPPRDAGPRPDAWVMPNFDTSTTWNATPLDCPGGPAHRGPRDLGTQRRFALAVLHYNVQYVAGGLTGAFLAGRQPFPDWGDDRVQDAIVTESLVPVLDLLDRHPTWTISLEMQSYFVEVMLARHRDVAQHLSDLVRSGQVELLSFHYSDQLFLAYPRSHMDHSHALGQRVLADGCLQASGPVFTQEGQFGEGMADLLHADPDAVLVLPKNLFSHEHGDGDVAPHYSVRGVPVVIGGRGVTDAASGFESVWTYMDDAELLATNGVNPYFPTSFVIDPTAVAAFETRLMDLETAGYAIAGVGDWVATLEAAGVAPTPLPPMLDGTWQPDNTGNLSRWMGDVGGFAATERDDGVLTDDTNAGRMVLAAETALAAATRAGVAPAGDDAELAHAWRDLLIGEVSDATGWNPMSTEVYYGRFHAEAASTRALGVIMRSASALGVSPPFTVDTRTGTVGVDRPAMTLEADPSPPFVVTPSGRAFTATWQREAAHPAHHVLTLEMPSGDGQAEVVFPWTVDAVRYTPALLDGTSVDLPMSAFTWTQTGISINAGPLGIGDALWLVLDTGTVAIAARLDATAHTVTFRDSSLPASDTARWVFHVVQGTADDALALADALNIHPAVHVDAP